MLYKKYLIVKGEELIRSTTTPLPQILPDKYIYTNAIFLGLDGLIDEIYLKYGPFCSSRCRINNMTTERFKKSEFDKDGIPFNPLKQNENNNK